MSDTLLGVLIGAGIAIVPPIVTTIIQAIIDVRKEKLRNKRLTYDKLIRYIYKIYNWRPSDNQKELNLLLEECTVNLALYGNKNLTKLLSSLTEHFLSYQVAHKGKNKEKMNQEKKKMKIINQSMKDIIMKDVKNK